MSANDRPIGGYDVGTKVKARLVPYLGTKIVNTQDVDDKTFYSIKPGDQGVIEGWFGLKAWQVKFDTCPELIACYPHEIERL